MDKYLEVVNETTGMHESCDVGGSLGCMIACVGGCLVTYMVGTAMLIAVADLN